MANVLVIADTQAPFIHKDYLAFLKAVQKKYKTDVTIHVGDLVDHHALGDWDHDPDGYSAGDELKAAIEQLKPYYRAFPDMLVCKGNHDERVFRRAMKYGIPRAYLREYREFLQAPKGWRWVGRVELDSVVYKHGVGYSGVNGAMNAAKDELKSCVIGHLHADAGVLFWANAQVLLFGMNVGSGIDKDAYAFEYGKHMRKKPILSCGVVIDGNPVLVVMRLNARGRWIGRL